MKAKLLVLAAMWLACSTMAAQPSSFSGPRKVIASDTHGWLAPVWSPDGSRLAVTGDNYTGIWVAQADGTDLHQVSQATGAGYQMRWADNNSLTSTPYSMDGMRRMTRIERVDARSGKVTLVADAVRDFKRSRVGKQTSALSIMLDDPANATVRLPELSAFSGKMVINPALSPDGTLIAFQVVGKGLFVCNADGTGVRSLGKGSHPSWLPDNRHVMVTRLQDDGEVFTQGDIYCVDITNGNDMNITPDSDVIPVTMSVSTDGTKLAFDNDVDGSIYVIDLKY